MADPVTWVVVISTGVSVASTIANQYQKYDEYGNQIDDNDAAFEAQKKLNEANWTAAKADAEQSAVDLGKNAAHTKATADVNRNFATTQLGMTLGSASKQIIQGNKQVSTLAGNVSRSNSSVAASIGASGVKKSGSAAIVAQESGALGNEAILDAKKNIFAGIRGTASEAAFGTEQNATAYDAAMYDKNAMLTKAAEIRASYSEGGTAYAQYQAGGEYASTIHGIQEKALERQQDNSKWYSPTSLLSDLSAGLNGASAGLQFSGSYTNWMKNRKLPSFGKLGQSFDAGSGLYFDPASGF